MTRRAPRPRSALARANASALARARMRSQRNTLTTPEVDLLRALCERMPGVPAPGNPTERQTWIGASAGGKSLRGDCAFGTFETGATVRIPLPHGLPHTVDHPEDPPDVRTVTTRSCRPDIVFHALRVAVFVHGCFWHGCPTHFNPPSTRIVYWTRKVRENRARDARIIVGLAASGWIPVVVWECQVAANAPAAADHVIGVLSARARKLGNGNPMGGLPSA